MLTGKQREMRERDELFLKVARTALLERGYQGVSIGRIAQTTGFSKGTIYQRFASKEELTVALGMRCRAKLLETIERAAQFAGRPRERMLALGEALGHYARRYPDDQRILKIIDAETILDRIPEDQQRCMAAYDVRMFQIILAIIEDGIAQGDLALPEGATPAGLCYVFWAMIDGSFAAVMGSAPLSTVGIADPVEEVVRSGQYLLDGYGWRPLQCEWDYAATSERIRAALSAEATPPDGHNGAVRSERGRADFAWEQSPT